jgi:hypothetical protein
VDARGKPDAYADGGWCRVAAADAYVASAHLFGQRADVYPLAHPDSHADHHTDALADREGHLHARSIADGHPSPERHPCAASHRYSRPANGDVYAASVEYAASVKHSAPGLVLEDAGAPAVRPGPLADALAHIIVPEQ